MSALAMLDAAPALSADLRQQIEACSAKADQLYLEASISDLKLGLEGIRSFIASGKEYNDEAYKYIEAEVSYLATEYT